MQHNNTDYDDNVTDLTGPGAVPDCSTQTAGLEVIILAVRLATLPAHNKQPLVDDACCHISKIIDMDECGSMQR